MTRKLLRRGSEQRLNVALTKDYLHRSLLSMLPNLKIPDDRLLAQPIRGCFMNALSVPIWQI